MLWAPVSKDSTKIQKKNLQVDPTPEAIEKHQTIMSVYV